MLVNPSASVLRAARQSRPSAFWTASYFYIGSPTKRKPSCIQLKNTRRGHWTQDGFKISCAYKRIFSSVIGIYHAGGYVIGLRNQKPLLSRTHKSFSISESPSPTFGEVNWFFRVKPAIKFFKVTQGRVASPLKVIPITIKHSMRLGLYRPHLLLRLRKRVAVIAQPHRRERVEIISEAFPSRKFFGRGQFFVNGRRFGHGPAFKMSEPFCKFFNQNSTTIFHVHGKEAGLDWVASRDGWKPFLTLLSPHVQRHCSRIVSGK